jgi:hypothetical protein
MILAFAIAITIAPPFYQTRPPASTSAAPTVTLPNNTTKIVMPPALIEDASEARKSADSQRGAARRRYEIALHDFLKSEETLFSLTAQLGAAKDARKQSREIEKQLSQMIRFLSPRNPKKTRENNGENSVPTTQAIADFTSAIAAVKPDLLRLNQEQKTTLDLPLQQSVVKRLQNAKTLVQRIR